MPQACAHCGSSNDDDLSVCFTCGQTILLAVRQGELIAGRYEIRNRLGKGGMGAVYRAFDRVLEEDIALKVLREDAANKSDAARRFRTEIKLARRVIHRNVCRIFEYGEDAGRRFISMELIEGTDLKRVIAQGSLTPDHAYEIAYEIAEGLDAIHGVGIVHRDLKTANIMLDAAGTVRLMDFGIAKNVGEGTTGATATGHVMGTPAYMSPEQARGQKVEFRSDIYALGVVIYELFTSRTPFEGDTPVAVIMKHIHDPPPLEGSAAAGLPPALVPVLRRALAKHREERQQSAEALARELDAASGGTASSLGSGKVGRPLGRTVKWSAPRAEDATPTEVHAPTQLETATALHVSTGAAKPPQQQTVLLRKAEARDTTGARRAIALALLGAALLSAVALLYRWRQPGAEPMATPVSVTTPAAPLIPVKQLVSLNALPWARIKLAAKGGPALELAETLVTPCLVELAPGSYAVELENGGLTPPATQEIRIAEGARNAFVFSMPPFDPARAARLAMEQRP